MLKIMILLILLAFSQTMPIPYSNQIVVDYTNGLVSIHVFNVSKVNLIGNNITGLNVTGANYTIKGNTLYLEGEEAVIEYHANFSRGVINVNETFNSYVIILIPNTYKIVYLNSPPLSYTSNGVQNITFYSNYVYIVFSENFSPLAENSNQLLLLLTIAGIVLSSITISFIIYQIFTSRSRVKVEEPSMKLGDEIDERDIQIMKILKNSSSNITKLAEETNIPRTTVYRRLRRLIKLGYVVEIRERNKVTYNLTDKGKDFIEKVRDE